MSKMKVLIIKPDNSYVIKKIKNPKETIEIDKKSYLLSDSLVDRKSGKKRMGIYSENNIFPINSKKRISADKVLDKVARGISYDSTTGDSKFQILLHTKVVKDMLASEQENLMMYLMIGIASLLMGLLIGLALGHVAL